MAFAGLDSGQSIGYVIPVSVVRLFLSSFEEHGEFLGVPSLGKLPEPSAISVRHSP